MPRHRQATGRAIGSKPGSAPEEWSRDPRCQREESTDSSRHGSGARTHAHGTSAADGPRDRSPSRVDRRRRRVESPTDRCARGVNCAAPSRRSGQRSISSSGCLHRKVQQDEEIAVSRVGFRQPCSPAVRHWISPDFRHARGTGCIHSGSRSEQASWRWSTRLLKKDRVRGTLDHVLERSSPERGWRGLSG